MSIITHIQLRVTRCFRSRREISTTMTSVGTTYKGKQTIYFIKLFNPTQMKNCFLLIDEKSMPTRCGIQHFYTKYGIKGACFQTSMIMYPYLIHLKWKVYVYFHILQRRLRLLSNVSYTGKSILLLMYCLTALCPHDAPSKWL